MELLTNLANELGHHLAPWASNEVIPDIFFLQRLTIPLLVAPTVPPRLLLAADVEKNAAGGDRETLDVAKWGVNVMGKFLLVGG